MLRPTLLCSLLACAMSGIVGGFAAEFPGPQAAGSKQISDQYGSVQILTTNGKIVAGRIVNLAGDTVRVQTNMMAPSTLTAVDRKLIEEIVPSKVSMMPTGLLNTLTKTEILDLMAYLLSRGDPQHAMFQSP